MTHSENYWKLRMYIGRYIREYPEFEHLTSVDISAIFADILEHLYAVAECYLGD